MKSIVKTFTLTCLISFVFGIWWGVYETEQSVLTSEAPFDIKVLSYTDSFPQSLLVLIEDKLKIKISITLADDIHHFIELTEKNDFDILFYKSYFANQVLQSQILQQIRIEELKNIKNIQADFWPSQKYNSKKSIPYSWGINGYSTLNKNTNYDLSNNTIFFFSQNYDFFFHYLYNEYPEIKNWIQSSKHNQIRELLKKKSTHISFYSQLSPDILQHYVSSSNGEHSRISSAQPDLKFVIPDSGGLFWMNLISLTQTGTIKNITHQVIDYLLSRPAQLHMTKKEHFSSITELEENYFQSAKYIRQVPISKIHFPLDTIYNQKTWLMNLNMVFPDISNSNKDSLKE